MLIINCLTLYKVATRHTCIYNRNIHWLVKSKFHYSDFVKTRCVVSTLKFDFILDNAYSTVKACHRNVWLVFELLHKTSLDEDEKMEFGPKVQLAQQMTQLSCSVVSRRKVSSFVTTWRTKKQCRLYWLSILCSGNIKKWKCVVWVQDYFTKRVFDTLWHDKTCCAWSSWRVGPSGIWALAATAHSVTYTDTRTVWGDWLPVRQTLGKDDRHDNILERWHRQNCRHLVAHIIIVRLWNETLKPNTSTLFIN